MPEKEPEELRDLPSWILDPQSLVLPSGQPTTTIPVQSNLIGSATLPPRYAVGIEMTSSDIAALVNQKTTLATQSEQVPSTRQIPSYNTSVSSGMAPPGYGNVRQTASSDVAESANQKGLFALQSGQIPSSQPPTQRNLAGSVTLPPSNGVERGIARSCIDALANQKAPFVSKIGHLSPSQLPMQINLVGGTTLPPAYNTRVDSDVSALANQKAPFVSQSRQLPSSQPQTLRNLAGSATLPSGYSNVRPPVYRIVRGTVSSDVATLGNQKGLITYSQSGQPPQSQLTTGIPVQRILSGSTTIPPTGYGLGKITTSDIAALVNQKVPFATTTQQAYDRRIPGILTHSQSPMAQLSTGTTTVPSHMSGHVTTMPGTYPSMAKLSTRSITEYSHTSGPLKAMAGTHQPHIVVNKDPMRSTGLSTSQESSTLCITRKHPSQTINQEALSKQIQQSRKEYIEEYFTPTDTNMTAKTNKCHQLISIDAPNNQKYKELDLWTLLEFNKVKSRMTYLIQALGILEKYATNLIKPTKPQYWRTVKFTSSLVRTYLDNVQGSTSILKQMGYSKEISDGLSFPEDVAEPDVDKLKELAADLYLARVEVEDLMCGQHPHLFIREVVKDEEAGKIQQQVETAAPEAQQLRASTPKQDMHIGEVADAPTLVKPEVSKAGNDSGADSESEYEDALDGVTPASDTATKGDHGPIFPIPDSYCRICGEKNVEIVCKECSDTFCGACDSLYHKHASRLHHCRERLEEMAPTTSTSSTDDRKASPQIDTVRGSSRAVAEAGVRVDEAKTEQRVASPRPMLMKRDSSLSASQRIKKPVPTPRKKKPQSPTEATTNTARLLAQLSVDNTSPPQERQSVTRPSQDNLPPSSATERVVTSTRNTTASAAARRQVMLPPSYPPVSYQSRNMEDDHIYESLRWNAYEPAPEELETVGGREEEDKFPPPLPPRPRLVARQVRTEPPSPPVVSCPNCHHLIAGDANACPVCHKPLTQGENRPTMDGPNPPATTPGGSRPIHNPFYPGSGTRPQGIHGSFPSNVASATQRAPSGFQYSGSTTINQQLPGIPGRATFPSQRAPGVSSAGDMTRRSTFPGTQMPGNQIPGASEVPDQEGEWQCEFCTLLNPVSKRVCDMCYKTRTENAKVIRSDPTPPPLPAYQAKRSLSPAHQDIFPTSFQSSIITKLQQDEEQHLTKYRKQERSFGPGYDQGTQNGYSAGPQGMEYQGYSPGGTMLPTYSQVMEAREMYPPLTSFSTPPPPSNPPHQAVPSSLPPRPALPPAPRQLPPPPLIPTQTLPPPLMAPQALPPVVDVWREMEEMRINGKHYVELLKKAEAVNFTPEEVNIAITLSHGQCACPVEWLKTTWFDFIHRVMIGVTEQSNQHDIGNISPEEARQALIEHTGDIQRAIEHCVGEREKKLAEVMDSGIYVRTDCIRALDEHDGDVDKAIRDLELMSFAPMRQRILDNCTPVSGGGREAPAPPVRQISRTQEQEIFKAIVSNKDIDMERRVRVMFAEKGFKSWGRAKTAVRLIDMEFPVEDSVVAAQENGDLERSIQFLQRECVLCAETKAENHMITMLNCQCRFCSDCVARYVSLTIQERNIMHLVCPACSEPKNLEDDTVATAYFNHLDILIRPLVDSTTHDLFQRKLRDRTLMKEPNFRWCSHCSSGFINERPQLIKMACPSCREFTCFKCKKQWEDQHEGLSCEQFAAWKEANDPEAQATGLAAHLKQNGIECPNCKFRYDLAKGGCMHFKCGQCSHEYCSGCYSPFRHNEHCTVSPNCARRGLHAHHPRDCLFYLRDRDPEELQQLLNDHNVAYNTEPPQRPNEDQGQANAGFEIDEEEGAAAALAPGHCRVLEQPEHGAEDKECGRPTPDGHAGLCRIHYIEYLVERVNASLIDPVTILTAGQLKLVLEREDQEAPEQNHREPDDDYRERLLQLVQTQLPLPRKPPRKRVLDLEEEQQAMRMPRVAPVIGGEGQQALRMPGAAPVIGGGGQQVLRMPGAAPVIGHVRPHGFVLHDEEFNEELRAGYDSDGDDVIDYDRASDSD